MLVQLSRQKESIHAPSMQLQLAIWCPQLQLTRLVKCKVAWQEANLYLRTKLMVEFWIWQQLQKDLKFYLQNDSRQDYTGTLGCQEHKAAIHCLQETAIMNRLHTLNICILRPLSLNSKILPVSEAYIHILYQTEESLNSSIKIQCLSNKKFKFLLQNSHDHLKISK